MTIWQPELDTVFSVEAQIGSKDTKDIPCSQWLGFWIRDGKLFTKFQMRSNDVIFGFSHINVPEFTILQEVIANAVSYHTGKDTKLGYYHHSVVSLHLYDFSRHQAEAILSDPRNHSLLLPKRTLPLMPKYECKDQDSLKYSFQRYYDFVAEAVELLKDDKPTQVEQELIKAFSSGNLKKYEIFWYSVLSTTYALFKTDKIRGVQFFQRILSDPDFQKHEEIYNQITHYFNRIGIQIGGSNG